MQGGVETRSELCCGLVGVDELASPDSTDLLGVRDYQKITAQAAPEPFVLLSAIIVHPQLQLQLQLRFHLLHQNTILNYF